MFRIEEVSPHFHPDIQIYSPTQTHAHAQILTPVLLLYSIALMLGRLEDIMV